LDLLILYLDGLCCGEHHVLSAVGVDSQQAILEGSKPATRQEVA
jgi:hypothetical protein